MISPEAKTRAERLIGSAETEGGNILLDGRGVQVEAYPNGNFIGPTVIEADSTMTCYKCVHIFLLRSLLTCSHST